MALDFFAGCVGGCAGVLVGHPLDTVKVRLQTQDFKNPIYRGTWNCFSTILRTEKLSGLYRGVSSPLGGVAVVNAIVFGVYGQAQRTLGGTGSPTESLTLTGHFAAGALAGLSQSFVCGPLELAKTRLQLTDRYSGSWQCLSSIARTEGLRGLTRGLALTLAREVPSFGTYFASYEFLTRGQSEVPTWKMLLAGGLAGSASWLVVYPVDVLKTRIQSDGVESAPRYSGALDCLKKSYRAEGIRFLSRGLAPTLVRAFPTNAVTFTAVSWTMRLAEWSPAGPPPLKVHHQPSLTVAQEYFSFRTIRTRSMHLFEDGTLLM